MTRIWNYSVSAILSYIVAIIFFGVAMDLSIIIFIALWLIIQGVEEICTTIKSNRKGDKSE